MKSWSGYLATQKEGVGILYTVRGSKAFLPLYSAINVNEGLRLADGVCNLRGLRQLAAPLWWCKPPLQEIERKLNYSPIR